MLGTALDLVDIILGEVTGDHDVPRHSRQFRQRLVDLSELADEDPAHGPTGLAALASGGRLRLLGGMVLANRPWRLAARLYRALIAAMATVAFALVTADIWRISASLDPIRLAARPLVDRAHDSLPDRGSRSLGALPLRARPGPGPALQCRDGHNRDHRRGVALSRALGVSLAGAGLLITPDALSRRLERMSAWLITSGSRGWSALWRR